jgi:hypothetical protein
MSAWLVLLGVFLSFIPAVHADPSSEMLEALRQQVQQLTGMVQQLQTTVEVQQRQIAQLERGVPAPVGQAAGIPPSTSGLRQISGGANLSAFNPEIGVVADLTGQLSESSADGEGNDKLSAREVELVFGHPIDPYSRLDVTATFSDFEETALEEAYITHWGLPGEITAKLGRMRPKIGKASTTHGERLETVDYPLVVQRYLGNEGLFRTGLELAEFIPAPWTTVTHELTAGMMEGGVGEGGSLFGETRRRPSYYAHLKNFWEVSDESNVELGATYLTGSRDDDSDLEVQTLGLDATLIHYVTPTNKLKWQTEAYLQDRDESFTAEVDGDTGEETSRTEFDNNPWGWYTLLDYRLSPRFGVGGRFDYVEPVDLDPSVRARHADTAWSGYLTLYQSEFARWRLQYRHTDFAAGGDDNAIFAQAIFIIGVDRHPLQ